MTKILLWFKTYWLEILAFLGQLNRPTPIDPHESKDILEDEELVQEITQRVLKELKEKYDI